MISPPNALARPEDRRVALLWFALLRLVDLAVLGLLLQRVELVQDLWGHGGARASAPGYPIPCSLLELLKATKARK